MKRGATSLFATSPKRVDTADDLVRFESSAERRLPLLARPSEENVSLADWAAENREQLRSRVHSAGGVLFRGFRLHGPEDFHRVISAIGGEELDYTERSSPRSRVQGNVFTSTDHPADQAINFHNELAYSGRWPMEIFFFCHTPAAEGGETPIADSRQVLANLSEETRGRFRSDGVMYTRYLGSGLGLHWHEVFQTENRSEVESFCREQGIDFEWEGECLRTRVVRPAIRTHPTTGEEVWFNHGHFFNIHSMAPDLRQQMLSTVERQNLPFNTCFGDGSEILPEVVREIDDAFAAARVEFEWEQGDLLYLDNMLTAHARNPYSGERRILVGMTGATSGLSSEKVHND